MSTELKLRRGTTAQNNAFTGAVGEVTIDTDKDLPVVHDGVTLGGHPVAARANADGSVSIINKAGATLETIAANGNRVVDVNTTEPALRVTQRGTGHALLIEDEANPDGTPVVVTSGGNLLVGTTTDDGSKVNVNGVVQASDIVSARTGSQGAISGDRNRVINGSCQIVNEPTFVAVDNSTGYGGPEMFFSGNSGAGGQFTQSQGSMTFGGVTLPTVRQTVNTANTNITAENFWFGISQFIEGFNAFDLRGKPVALSFVLNTNVSGTYSVAIREGSGNRSYVTTITAVANTPVQVTIPVSAIPSAANIPNTNAIGLIVNVGFLNTGTFQTATLNQWQSGNFISATGATNWGATAGNFIELTNLQLEEGTVATPFIRRSFGQELALTQRYFEASGTAGLVFSGNVSSGENYFSSGNYKVTKRAVPTIVITTNAAASFPNTPSIVINSTVEGFRSSSIANTTGTGEKAEEFTASARL